jgi:hypothetical protein
MKKIIVGMLFTASLIALAQSAPKAVLFRLDLEETVIVAALENNKWAVGEKLSVSSQTAINGGLPSVLLNNTGLIGKAMIGGKISTGSLCDWVRVTDISTPVKLPYLPTYAISAAWNSVPRAITALPTSNATYQKVMTDELKKRNISKPVILSQVIQTDLDGDKTNEVLLVAQNPRLSFDAQNRLNGTYGQEKGEYSLVQVRKVVAGKVQTFTLSERIVTKVFDGTSGQPQVLTQFISAIADINGDGKMEIFVDDLVHEGYGVTIYTWNGKGFTKMLEWGCGV